MLSSLLMSPFVLPLPSSADTATSPEVAVSSETSAEKADVSSETSAKKAEVSSEADTKNVKVSRYVQIPILYMTDREKARRDFGAFRMNEQGHVYRVPCGTLEYTMANDKGKNAWSESLGWKPATKPGKVPFSVAPLNTDNNKEDVYSAFGDAVAEAAKKSANNEIFIFVHGYNNSFEVAAARAARLAYVVQCPVVLYSWPSTAKLLQYDVDAGNNEWSQEHFNRLMEELMIVQQKNKMKVNLVAHSMGNRLAVRSAPITAGKHFFSQVFLVDPDFDAETFVHYALRYLHGGETSKAASLRILFSRKDKALPFAQLLFGGYTRVGQGADVFLESLFNPLDLPKKLQDTADKLAKLNPLASADGPGADEQEAKARLHNRFEWIDFTLLDHGFIGHSVPYELIASLWSTGKPGDGLALINDEAGHVNRFTGFVARCFKQKQRIGEWGKCEKVVLANDAADAPPPPKN
jgi:pimeloyl-ACP methyl ester carboxylesterase